MMDQNEKTAKMLGIVSLICSLFGLACLYAVAFIRMSGLWYSFGCLALSVTALVMSTVSRHQQNRHNAPALAGMIISIVTLAMLLMLWLLVLVLLLFFSHTVELLSGLGRMG